MLRFFWSTNSSVDATDTPLAAADVDAIDAGVTVSGQATLTIPAVASTGTYYVIAEADSAKAVQESSETNNGAARTVRVGGDLIISTFDAPAMGGAGLPVVLGDTTKNAGASAIGASITHFYLSANALLSATDTLLGTRAVDPLGPDRASIGSTTLTVPSGTPAGSYYLFAKADGGSLVAETQEGNNAAIRSFAIGPDLIVSITSAPSPIIAGTPALIQDIATNRGGAEAGPSTVMYYLSTNYTLEAADQLIAERSAGPLAAGMSSTATTSITVPAGTAPGYYYLIAKADAASAVAESSETNNTRARQIRVN